MISRNWIRGMDLSSLPQVEACGGRFYCAQKKKYCDSEEVSYRKDREMICQDPLEILKENGWNLVRLRLWKDPRSPEGEPYGGGNTDLDHVLEMARRVKSAGIPWLLDFHYSDFWADPGHQKKPKEWQAKTGEELEQAVYEYTKSVLEQLSAEDLLPLIVQTGNEVTNGMLWPEGRVDVFSDEKSGQPDSFHEEPADSFSRLTRLLGAGIRAVRDLAPSARVMIHLDNGGNKELYRRWFSLYRRCKGAEFDIIGMSYYPFWHGSLQDLRENMTELAEETGKKLLIAETSYGFTLEDYGDYEQLPPDRRCGMTADASLASPLPWPMSPEGQAAFLRDLTEVIAGIPGGMGYIYWEPCLLPLPGTGWASEAGLRYLEETGRGGNSWANQALFDYYGRELPALRQI